MFGIRPHRSRCPPLQSIEHVLENRRIKNAYPVRVRPIPTACISGTINRFDDFDACFRANRPLLEQRVRDVSARYLEGGYPPIEVVAVRGNCYLRDGHKRLAAAHRTGVEWLDADVVRIVLSCKRDALPS